MTTNTSQLFNDFSQMLRQAFGPAMSVDAEGLLSMCTEDIVFEFPFAPDAAISRLEGKEALADYLPRVAALIEIEKMELLATYNDVSSDTFVIEFKCFGTSRLNGARYDQDYVSIVHLRDGLIAHYKDYWNPLVVLQAADSQEELRATLKGKQSND